MRELREKVIVITGSGDGIGAATALACAAAGMNLVLNDLNHAKVERTAAMARSIGARVAIVPGDVAALTTTQRLISTAEQRLGGVYAVFANAGIGQHRVIIDFPPADVRRLFEVNFFASLELLRAAARVLIRAGRPGHLMMCSSCTCRMTLAGHGIYSATKAAQHHVCRAMSMELRPYGIAVSCIIPGIVRTNYFSASDRTSDEAFQSKNIMPRIPRCFVQEPEDIARGIIKCLRRPRCEVWSQPIFRMAAAIMTAFPLLMEFEMRRRFKAKDSSIPARSAADLSTAESS
jgi:NAD(P)-dependent dehydrogenase (short-subunit alcohol dehydrogenase family)